MPPFSQNPNSTQAPKNADKQEVEVTPPQPPAQDSAAENTLVENIFQKRQELSKKAELVYGFSEYPGNFIPEFNDRSDDSYLCSPNRTSSLVFEGKLHDLENNSDFLIKRRENGNLILDPSDDFKKTFRSFFDTQEDNYCFSAFQIDFDINDAVSKVVESRVFGDSTEDQRKMLDMLHEKLAKSIYYGVAKIEGDRDVNFNWSSEYEQAEIVEGSPLYHKALNIFFSSLDNFLSKVVAEYKESMLEFEKIKGRFEPFFEFVNKNKNQFDLGMHILAGNISSKIALNIKNKERFSPSDFSEIKKTLDILYEYYLSRVRRAMVSVDDLKASLDKPDYVYSDHDINALTVIKRLVDSREYNKDPFESIDFFASFYSSTDHETLSEDENIDRWDKVKELNKIENAYIKECSEVLDQLIQSSKDANLIEVIEGKIREQRSHKWQY